jgi:hypothetical protein
MREADQAWAEGDRDIVPATPTPSESPPPADDIEAIKRERDEARQNYAHLEGRTNQVLQALHARQQEQAQVAELHTQRQQIPEASVDPVGHLLKRQELLEQREAMRLQQEQAAAQQQQQVQAITGLVHRAQQAEKEFEGKQSDYADAIAYLTAGVGRELEASGYSAQERAAIIQEQGLGVAARALQLKKNPAELLYQTAIERGYRPGRGSPRQALERVERGQQHARSLGSMGGRGPVPLTVDRLLEASDAEFAKLMETSEGLALLGA